METGNTSWRFKTPISQINRAYSEGHQLASCGARLELVLMRIAWDTLPIKPVPRVNPLQVGRVTRFEQLSSHFSIRADALDRRQTQQDQFSLVWVSNLPHNPCDPPAMTSAVFAVDRDALEQIPEAAGPGLVLLDLLRRGNRFAVGPAGPLQLPRG
jgi:hypothetical protein